MPHTVFPQEQGSDSTGVRQENSDNMKNGKGNQQNATNQGKICYLNLDVLLTLLVCDEAPGICTHLLTIFSLLLVVLTLPFSLLVVVKVVQVRFFKNS